MRTYLLYITAFFMLGYFQEWIKIQVNSNIELAQSYSGYDELTLEEKVKMFSANPDRAANYKFSHQKWEPLLRMDLRQLKLFKIGVNVFFVMVFYSLGLLFVTQAEFSSFLYNSLYALLFIGVVVFYMISNLSELFYPVCRRALGVMQSPIPLIFVVLISKVKKNNVG